MYLLEVIHSYFSQFSSVSYSNLALLLLAVFLAYLSVSTYLSWQRLRHVPGPPAAAFSKWWMLRNTLRGNMHLALKQACEDYGKRRPAQLTSATFPLHRTRHAGLTVTLEV